MPQSNWVDQAAVDSDVIPTGTQQSAIANLTTVATTGTLPTANGAVTIADAATPTVAELLEYCVELEAKLEASLAAQRAFGIIAS